MKFYFTNATAPATTIPFMASSGTATNWEQATATLRRLLGTTPSGVNAAAAQAETSAAASYDVALGQWVSAPVVTAGTVQGAFSLVVAVQESNTAADLFVKMIVYVVSGDNTTIRGIATSTSATAENPTTLTGRAMNGTLVNTVSAQVGDRIVVELGYRAANTVTTSYTGTIRYGGTDATDLASGDTGTNATTRPATLTLSDPAVDALFTASSVRGGDHFHALAA